MLVTVVRPFQLSNAKLPLVGILCPIHHSYRSLLAVFAVPYMRVARISSHVVTSLQVT